MPKTKLTKTIVDAATADEDPYELRDTIIPGVLAEGHPDGTQDIHHHESRGRHRR